jgi:prephenate dehydrogenase
MGGQVTDRIRAGIVGVGFMGTVQARATRRSGGVISRVAGSTASYMGTAEAEAVADPPRDS